ncbi:MAG: hypothetical protein IKT67_12910 [Lachnospiraceae bacterium]|nr:hypothetical protein [Lachnospiraceae bacterium]
MNSQLKEICKMCDNYCTDAECENERDCKIAKLVDENRTLKAENKRVRKELSDLRLQMSYIHNPNTIGDRHEMGAW